MLRFLLSLCFFFLLACCQKSKKDAMVFFGGEIVNPTSEHIVLFRNDSVIDSVKLDKNNRFAFKLRNIDEGLYHFDHSPELQYIYLKKGDSILMRLNTIEFDESLVFSGKGSEINNFLIEMFLAHEQEKVLMEEYYTLDPDAFNKKIDSLQTQKKNSLQALTDDYPLSEKALKVAKATIDYTIFTHKEKYPFYHKHKTGKDIIHELPDSFYAYRKTVDINNKELTYFKPYFAFMKYHLGNISYVRCKKDYKEKKTPEDDYLYFSTYKLNLVDSLVKEEELRNLLFRNVVINHLLKKHKSREDCQTFIEKFQTLSTNQKHKEEIRQLYQNIQKLQPDKALPNVLLTDINNNKVSLKEISKNHTTVFYFWTGTQKEHLKDRIQHIKTLKETYPDHQFVGINLRASYPQWKGMVEAYRLDTKQQFYGENFKELQTAMLIDGLNKCVIAKDTLIIDGFADLYTSLPLKNKKL